MLTLLPSRVLSFMPLSPAHFGVLEGTVEVDGVAVPAIDIGANPVRSHLETAVVIVSERVSVQDAKFELACIYLAQAYLYMHLGAEKAANVGLVTGRGGQVNIPLGSYGELLRAANAAYRMLLNLYPDVDWPMLDEVSAGSMQPTGRF